MFVLLQRVAHALDVGEGCAVTASYPEVRSDHHHANSFRTAPSLCADMIFGKDKGQPAPGRTRDRPGIRPVFHNNAAEVFGLGCQRRRSLTSQSEIFAGAAAKSE